MKVGREHRVLLSGEAPALLRALPCQGNVIFSGRKRGAQLSDMSLTAVLRRMQFDDITVPGSRSSFSDWCAEAAANTFSREVCEHALAHRLPDRKPPPRWCDDLFD
jgi:integrase